MQARAHYAISGSKNTTLSSIAREADVITKSSRSSKQQGVDAGDRLIFDETLTADADWESNHRKLWADGETTPRVRSVNRLGMQWLQSANWDARCQRRRGLHPIRAATYRSHCLVRALGPKTQKAPVCYHRARSRVGTMYAYDFMSSDPAQAHVRAGVRARAIARTRSGARRGFWALTSANAGDSSRSRCLLHDGDAR